MNKLMLMLKTHQPIRIAEYSFFDLGKHKNYFNDSLNRAIINRVSDSCYLPVNRLLKHLIRKSGGEFVFSVSMSGTTISQLEKYRPDVLESFVDLVGTGSVEVVCEPYYYSLAFHYSRQEFKEQIMDHVDKVEQLFGVQPTTFLNTEYCYNNDLGSYIYNAGFRNMVTEGADWVLHGRSPNQVFRATEADINLFLRNYQLSNDIKFRYSDFGWKHFPLTPEKYCQWVTGSAGEIVPLFYDYENFGEHHKRETGILNFLEQTLVKLLKNKRTSFRRFQDIQPKDHLRPKIDVPYTVSRADTERDLSAWRGNAMQHEALTRVYEMGDDVRATQDEDLITLWRLFQTSDHFYYMSTKSAADGSVHRSFSPFYSPHDAYRHYMNILSDFELRVARHLNINPVSAKKFS